MERGRKLSITSYYKRKTEDTSFEELDPFAKSKKTDRSPERNKNTKEKQMEGKIEELTKMISTVIGEIRVIREENAEWKKDIKELKEEMARKDKKIEYLENKVEYLEKRMERKELQEIRNNIVIKGLQVNEEDRKKEVENFLTTNLEVDVTLKDIKVIGKDKKIIIATTNTWEEKKQIMLQKNKLKERENTAKIYIDYEKTEQERKIQKHIQEVANEYKKEGKEIKIGYQKVRIDGKMWFWDKKTNKLTDEKN